jgi:hypothetical protein
MFQSTTMKDTICTQLIQLSSNKMIINTTSHQFLTLCGSVIDGSLDSDEEFCCFNHWNRYGFDLEGLCIW